MVPGISEMLRSIRAQSFHCRGGVEPNGANQMPLRVASRRWWDTVERKNMAEKIGKL